MNLSVSPSHLPCKAVIPSSHAKPNAGAQASGQLDMDFSQSSVKFQGLGDFDEKRLKVNATLSTLSALAFGVATVTGNPLCIAATIFSAMSAGISIYRLRRGY